MRKSTTHSLRTLRGRRRGARAAAGGRIEGRAEVVLGPEIECCLCSCEKGDLSRDGAFERRYSFVFGRHSILQLPLEGHLREFRIQIGAGVAYALDDDGRDFLDVVDRGRDGGMACARVRDDLRPVEQQRVHRVTKGTRLQRHLLVPEGIGIVRIEVLGATGARHRLFIAHHEVLQLRHTRRIFVRFFKRRCHSVDELQM
ncbi:hypothetical protein PFISCL1PPCAC_563, partial [Pristionchus fissidentatus]